MSESQIFDLIVLALLAWMTLRGLMLGMVSQLASLVALALSWAVATQFSPNLAPLISAEPPWNKICAMLILFLGTTVAIMVLKRCVAGVLKTVRLQNFDRLLGAVFGLLKGVILCLIITFFAVTLSDRSKTMVFDSVCGTYLVHGVDKVGALLPDDANILVKKSLDGFRERVQTEIPDNNKNLLDSVKGILEKVPFWGTNPSTSFKGQEETSTFSNSVPHATMEPARLPFAHSVDKAIAPSVDSAVAPSVGSVITSSVDPVIAPSVETSSKRNQSIGTVTPFQPSMTGFPPMIPSRNSGE
ncbi:MAG: CvpA family protein [Thermoguttaceae bacterium]